jgi:hypothetical protein
VEASDPHRKRLEPFLDQISRDVVEVTAQIGLRKSGQVAHAVNEEFRLREVVMLLQLCKEHAGEIVALPTVASAGCVAISARE